VPSSASAAEDMANFIIWEIERIGPLCFGKGLFSETKMWAPALLRVWCKPGWDKNVLNVTF
jgi:hypothetical protein